MQPTPRRHGESEQEYNARVMDAMTAIYDGRVAAWIEQERKAGRGRKLTRRELNQIFGKE